MARRRLRLGSSTPLLGTQGSLIVTLASAFQAHREGAATSVDSPSESRKAFLFGKSDRKLLRCARVALLGSTAGTSATAASDATLGAARSSSRNG